MTKIGNLKTQNTIEQKGQTSELSNAEKNEIVMKECLDYLIQDAQRRVPESHKFAPCRIQFRLEGTNNIGKIEITHDEEEYKTQRRVTFSVSHKNSDAVFKNYIFKGTKKEVIDFLSKKQTFEDLKQTISYLSKKVDEHYNSNL